MEINDAIALVVNECMGAQRKFPKFNSAHEGYAVILEELDELWEEIKTKERESNKMQKEAVQVAAMGLRFLTDCCKEGRTP